MKDPLQVLVMLLGAIAVLMLMAVIRLGNIDRRLRQRFPTAKEEDHDWALSDPMGHWEAHKNDKKG